MKAGQCGLSARHHLIVSRAHASPWQLVASNHDRRLSLHALRIPLPTSMLESIDDASVSWAQACLAAPLVDEDTGVHVHLYGCAHFAPGQQRPIEELMRQLRPSALVLEQPLTWGGSGTPGNQAARLRLPYPPFIDSLVGRWDSHPLDLSSVADDADAAWIQELGDELSGSVASARVGRDVLDPNECFGWYAGLDFVTAPQQIAAALQLFGFAPGLEYAAAVQQAQREGIQVLCADAPLKLQEAWVREMLAGFNVQEARMKSWKMMEDARQLQELVPQELQAWDRSLPEEAMNHLPGKRQRQEGCLIAGMLPFQVQVALLASDGPPEQKQLLTMAAFKVSRALCAGCLLEDSSSLPFSLILDTQARLQPLKFGHFERRALHVAQQLREACQRVSTRRAETVVLSSTVAGGELAAPSPASSSLGTMAGRPLMPPGSQPNKAGRGLGGGGVPDIGAALSSPAILVVLGRQYVPTLRALWENKSSPLYRKSVPRTFADSMLEPKVDAFDPDVEHGGSRPVGYVAKSLAELFPARGSSQGRDTAQGPVPQGIGNSGRG